MILPKYSLSEVNLKTFFREMYNHQPVQSFQHNTPLKNNVHKIHETYLLNSTNPSVSDHLPPLP